MIRDKVYLDYFVGGLECFIDGYSPNYGRNPFYTSIIGIWFLNICHYFGFKSDTWYEADITIDIPVIYNLPSQNFYAPIPDTILEDISKLVYQQFKVDPRLERNCQMAGYVYVKWDINDWNSKCFFGYNDGIIFLTKEQLDMHIKSKLRDSKLDKIL